MSLRVFVYLGYSVVTLHANRGALSNGHHLKDSSPNTAPPTGNSTQATSLDEFDSTEANGVDAAALKANHIASKVNADLAVTGEDDAPQVASPNQVQNNIVELPEEGADNTTIEVTSPLPQQTTSALHEEPLTVPSEQNSEFKDQIQQADGVRSPELANGSLDDHLGVAEGPLTNESQTPLPSSADLNIESLSSDQHQTQDQGTSQAFIITADVPHHPPVPLADGKLPEEPLDPAPSPVQPADASKEAVDSEPMAIDQQISTVPQSPSKVSRPREDDGDEEPAAKRSKVDDEPLPDTAGSTNTEFKVPAQPGNEPLSITTQTPSEPLNPITVPQKKHLIKTISNLKRSIDGKPFEKPVDPVALGIPTYPSVIKNPMDLRTLEEKLKNNKYSSLQAFRSDFNLIVENAVTFNGNDHFITLQARKIEAAFERGMANLPGPEVQGPAPGDKKRKSSLPPAGKVGPSRRDSRMSLPAAPAPSPVTTQSPTTFALKQGIPLIRRDSTKGDGRPKREIHPPAPRDLPYANSKPKKKKYQAELKFCLHVLNELGKPRYAQWTQPFAAPVDPVALNIPDYHSVIKKPMDLRTVKEKLDNSQYENAKEFESDVRLMFANCHKYNGVDHPIRHTARTLEGIFDQEMAQKRAWLEANSPVSGAQSTTSSDAEEDDDEDEEEEIEEAADDQLSKLQRSIAEMSRQVEMLKAKKNTPPAVSKKVSKSGKSDKKASKKSAAAPSVKPEKKAPAKSKKETYVTYEQKQDISNRINSLSEKQMARALKIIRDNMPNLKVYFKPFTRIFLRIRDEIILEHELNIQIGQGVQDDELELDIDELSDDVLRKLWEFVKKNSKAEEVRAPAVVSTAPVPSKKKNKPMSKQEQERQIQDLKHISSQFQNPMPSTESAPQVCKYSAVAFESIFFADGRPDNVHHDSSGDEEDSEESEEE